MITALCRQTSVTAGIVAARAVLDAGIDTGFGHWIHSAQVAYQGGSLDGTALATAITDRETGAETAFRAVSVMQRDRVVARGQVSFEAPSFGAHAEELVGMGDNPDPYSVPAVLSPATPAGFPVDIRPIDDNGRTWVRFRNELPDDLLVHVAALALTVDPVVAGALHDYGDYQPINYGLWIHRCFRADDWVLLSQTGSRAYGHRTFFTYALSSSQGREIATIAQEVRLFRRIAP
ncbi:acyl-CoA thioesterase [Mycolicibacterium sp. XJ879]